MFRNEEQTDHDEELALPSLCPICATHLTLFASFPIIFFLVEKDGTYASCCKRSARFGTPTWAASN